MSSKPDSNDSNSRRVWTLCIAAAAILMVTMGVRQTTGLFVSPLNTSTGLGIVSISFALAIGQFVWGATQPIFGAIADKYGSVKVIIFGTLLLAAGTALTPFMHSELGLIVTLGILAAGGAGAGSFSILIGATARQLPPESRSFAAGFINAGGSFGQFLFAPIVQAVITGFGWVAAMMALAVAALASIPLALPFRDKDKGVATGAGAGNSTAAANATGASNATSEASAAKAAGLSSAAASTAAAASPPIEIGLKRQLRIAMRDRSYLYLHAGFFGAWLGGISMASHGNYTWMWYADIALALFAAVVNLPIKEAPVVRKPIAKTVPA